MGAKKRTWKGKITKSEIHILHPAYVGVCRCGVPSALLFTLTKSVARFLSIAPPHLSLACISSSASRTTYYMHRYTCQLLVAGLHR